MNIHDTIRSTALHQGREKFPAQLILNARIITPENHHLWFPHYVTDQLWLPGIGQFVTDAHNYNRQFDPTAFYRRWLSHAPGCRSGSNVGSADWLYPGEKYFFSCDGFHWQFAIGSMLDGLPCLAADFALRMGYIGLRHPSPYHE